MNKIKSNKKLIDLLKEIVINLKKSANEGLLAQHELKKRLDEHFTTYRK